MKVDRLTPFYVVLTAALLLIAGATATGCSSTKKQSRDQNAEVGQPPADDDPDREVASPPDGPRVDIGDDGESAGEVDEAAPADDSPAVSSQQIETFMAKGPSYALTVTRVEPHRIDGTFAGFEIIAMHPSASRFVGEMLKVGDVITHINGVRMKKPDDYLAAWKLLDDVDAVRVKFLRGGDEEVAAWRVSDADEASTPSSEASE